jgi:nickel/cobalt exporter
MRRFFHSAVLLLVMGTLPASAHPHVFINNKVTVRFDGGVLQGIGFTWTFDEMFSNMILSDYDPKHTAHFDAAQVKAVKGGAFDNLANYHYFIALAVGKRPLSHFAIERFTPTVVDANKLVYSFFVPLKIPVGPEDQTVRLTVYDDSYYVAFDLLHLDDVTVQAGPDVACNLSIEKTKVKPLWPGQYMPDQLVIGFKGSS